MNQITVVASELVASADLSERTISGIAVPYGGSGLPGGAFRGRPVTFRYGSLSRSLAERSSKVRLIVDHDTTRVVGRLAAHDDGPEGLSTTWRIARTPAGDAVLAEAAEGIRDGLSVGVDVLDFTETRDAVEVVEARLVEVSLVAFPAYDAARVSRVAAHITEPAHGIDPRVIHFRIALRSHL